MFFANLCSRYGCNINRKPMRSRQKLLKTFYNMYKFSTEGMTECGYPVWGGCGYGYGHHKEGLGSNVGGTALVILLILIAIALFWGFQSAGRKADEREMKADERRLADNLYSLNGRLGIVEKGVVDNSKEISRNDAILTGLTQDYSFRIGGLTCRTDYNSQLINEMSIVGARPATYCPPYGFAPVAGVAPVAAGCGCGNARNAAPEFVQRSVYVQDGTPEIIVRNSCGNSLDA